MQAEATSSTANLMTEPAQSSFFDSTIVLTRTYPHARAKVWRALTEPALRDKWLMKSEGFSLAVGTKFRLSDKPNPRWRGYVDCEILAVEAPTLLQHSWVGDDDQKVPHLVTFRLRDAPSGGTTLHFEHKGFQGGSGWLLSKLIMGPGWKKIAFIKLAAILVEMP